MDRTLLNLLCVLIAAAICVGETEWDGGCMTCRCTWVSGRKTAECSQQNFTGIPNNLSAEIQTLDLTSNRISRLPRNAFAEVKLVNLHKLNLRECGIETIHTEAFNGLSIIIEIDLTGNKLRVLNPGTFRETQRLRVLLLNQNLIKKLSDGLFHNLTYLQKVEITDNRLWLIETRTFYNVSGLVSLTLGGNQLTNVQLATFDNLPRVGSLELQNNPWNCDCHLKDFRDWTIEKRLYTDPTTCNEPPSLAGRSWITINSDDFACRPEILFVGPASKIETGSGNVTLTCHVTGKPLPRVTWLHRKRSLTNSTRRYNGESRGYILSDGGKWVNLTIPNAAPPDKGEYVCQAKSAGGVDERNVTLSIIGDAVGGNESGIGLPLALGLGLAALVVLLLLTIVLCICYYRRRRSHRDEKMAEANNLEHHGLGEQEKSLITAINPVVKPPRRYEAAPSVTSHGTEMTELNRTLLDNDSVFAGGGIGDDDREPRVTPELDGGTLPRGANHRQYPPDLLAFSGGRGASPTSQASTAPDSSRLPSQSSNFSPTTNLAPYPANFKTLPHNRSGAPYTTGPPVMPRHGYVTIPRRPRAPSWSSAPPTSPDTIEPVYDNLGLRTTADGSSVLSLNKSPEPSGMRGRPLPGTPTSHYPPIQRSTPNILATSPTDRAAPEGAPEWPSKLSDEMDVPFLGGTLGRKVPPRPPPKPKKKSANGPLYEDEGEDGTEV